MNIDEIIQEHTKTLPTHLKTEVFDFVLFLEQKNLVEQTPKDRRKTQLKAALDKAVALDMFANIDGLEWQNQLRQDRAIGYDE